MKRKAQIFSTEALMALVVITFLIGSAVSTHWQIRQKTVEQEVMIETGVLSEEVLDKIILSPGDPEDWQKNPLSANLLGLSLTNIQGVVDYDKLLALKDLVENNPSIAAPHLAKISNYHDFALEVYVPRREVTFDPSGVNTAWGTQYYTTRWTTGFSMSVSGVDYVIFDKMYSASVVKSFKVGTTESTSEVRFIFHVATRGSFDVYMGTSRVLRVSYSPGDTFYVVYSTGLSSENFNAVFADAQLQVSADGRGRHKVLIIKKSANAPRTSLGVTVTNVPVSDSNAQNVLTFSLEGMSVTSTNVEAFVNSKRSAFVLEKLVPMRAKIYVSSMALTSTDVGELLISGKVISSPVGYYLKVTPAGGTTGYFVALVNGEAKVIMVRNVGGIGVGQVCTQAGSTVACDFLPAGGSTVYVPLGGLAKVNEAFDLYFAGISGASVTYEDPSNVASLLTPQYSILRFRLAVEGG